MYLRHFGLQREPFSIAPDPQFLFMSERHQEALAHLRYGLQSSGGFVVLSGEIGAGKTTLCRCLMEQVPADCQVAYLFNPKLSERELLQSVCADFGIEPPPGTPGETSIKALIDALNRHLLDNHAKGRHSVLIVDEAQALSPGLLEQLRLLTNLETNERKLLQIVLIGQPELRDMLDRPELEQLAQRVVARFHLQTLSSGETEQYVRHRLAVAGWDGSTAPMPFDAATLRRVQTWSQGVPRRINLLCDRALLGAFAEGTHRVRPAMIDQAAREVFGTGLSLPGGVRPSPWVIGVASLAVLATTLGLVWVVRQWPGPKVSARIAPTAASAPASAADPTSVRAKMPEEAISSGVAAAPPAVQAATAGASASLANAAPRWITDAELSALVAGASTVEAEAWRELAMVWLLTPLDGDPCTATAALGVPCHKQRGTLALLKLLDRPAVLPLYGADGQPHYAQLLGVSDLGVRLRLAGRVVQMPPATLATAWRGEFGVLWRTPPGSVAVSGADPMRIDPTWLDAQLSHWGSGTTPPWKGVATAPLRAKIRRFQLALGLEPDGLPGALTLMQLNRVAGIDEPRLHW